MNDIYTNHNDEDIDDLKEVEEKLSDEDEGDENNDEDNLTVVSSHDNNDNDPLEICVGDGEANSSSRCKEEARLDTLMEVCHSYMQYLLYMYRVSQKNVSTVYIV